MISFAFKNSFFKACNMSAMVKGIHLACVDIGKAVQNKAKMQFRIKGALRRKCRLAIRLKEL